MQNKNRILKRGGFAVIAAVFLMLLITLMMLKMLSYSTDVAQRTTNLYLYEQAVLLAYNATEDAMLQISEQDPATAGCVSGYTKYYPSTGTPMFDITVSVSYVWYSVNPPTAAGCATGALYVNNPEQNGSAIVTVTVKSDASVGLDEPIRYYRKTLQKM